MYGEWPLADDAVDPTYQCSGDHAVRTAVILAHPARLIRLTQIESALGVVRGTTPKTDGQGVHTDDDPFDPGAGALPSAGPVLRP